MSKVCKVCGTELTPENRYGNYLYCKDHGKNNHAQKVREFYERHPEYLREYEETHPGYSARKARKHEETHPGSQSRRAREWRKKNLRYYAQKKREWRKKNPLAWKLICARKKSTRRALGDKSINAPVEDFHFHHFLKEVGIYVPEALHNTFHSHTEKDFEKLRLVNKKILEWLNKKPSENLLVIEVFVKLLEDRFGKDYFL